MTTVTLGRTGITVGKNAFGAIPIQRIPAEDAVRLLHRAFDGGITFFDSARAYHDSEEKLGLAFEGMRDKVSFATKSLASTPDALRRDLETSLRLLRTDHIDLYQFHNPGQCYLPGDGTGMFEAMQTFQKEGKIRFIGMTNHRHAVANAAIDSGLYDTLQFPFSYLCIDRDLELVEKCREANIGFIAMKGLAGGVLNNSAACYAFMSQFANVLPIWGIQYESELDEFLAHAKNPPAMDDAMRAVIEADRKALYGAFCHGCGYCMPCPAGIEINNCARMGVMLKKLPYRQFLSKDWQEKMRKIEDCLRCGKCMGHCPYSLATPDLLAANYEIYKKFLAEHAGEVEP